MQVVASYRSFPRNHLDWTPITQDMDGLVQQGRGYQD